MAAAIVLSAAMLYGCRGDRQVLFDIRNHVRAGMSRPYVMATIEQYGTSSVHVGVEGDRLRLTSHDACVLLLEFKNQQLVERPPHRRGGSRTIRFNRTEIHHPGDVFRWE